MKYHVFSNQRADFKAPRPRAGGKFLFVGDAKLYVRGVTYGTFRPSGDGIDFPDPEHVARDFEQMAAHGINAVRTYTPPPRWLLDLAARFGLFVMAGLPWEQHITFMDERSRANAIEERVREGVRACAGHPAVLCYTIGNEIPGSIVRWHGKRKISRFLERLYRAAKEEDPGGLVTYVNFPTTEYLDLPFLDFVSFNVYLEQQPQLEAYLARLQNIAGDRPLVMAEIGFDSRRHGEERQAQTLDWQVRTAFSAGCAGVFIFAWTDEWYRGGYEIEDWDFGLTGRDRRPKRALTAVRQAFAEVPFASQLPWPAISVVVCTHNGRRTIAECLEHITRLDYPNYEVLVIDDGSTDDTAALAARYPVRLIRTANCGLSAARNTGYRQAKGEVVAYIDDDAYPDPHWLMYLAHSFLDSSNAGVGGPNLQPAGGLVAECVANAPGGPVHVLLSDREAEHIPGCNCAFRRDRLEAVGGFDPAFRVAGDDVDLCWRLRARGWTLGFSPAALVWHHRRNSVRAYWKQQRGYGKAEALLAKKWPDKYNAAGHISWAGRLYGSGITRAIRRWRIYHGTWGSAPFQSLYQGTPGRMAMLPLVPEWYLVNAALLLLAALGWLWRPLLGALPLLTLSVGAPVIYIVSTVACARFPHRTAELWKARLLTAALHALQPLARLSGRFAHGLTPWRSHWRFPMPALVWPLDLQLWSEHWRAPEAWLYEVEANSKSYINEVRRGGDFDSWDLEIRGGLLGGVCTRMAVEEHGAGRQLLRFHVWPRCWKAALLISGTFAALAGWAMADRSETAGVVLSAAAVASGLWTLRECTAAMRGFVLAVQKLQEQTHGSGSAPRPLLTVARVRTAGIGSNGSRDVFTARAALSDNRKWPATHDIR